jgi:hypothetical protein
VLDLDGGAPLLPLPLPLPPPPPPPLPLLLPRLPRAHTDDKCRLTSCMPALKLAEHSTAALRTRGHITSTGMR